MKFKHSEKFDANPLMGLIIGKTGCGKTRLLFEMLTTPGCLDYSHLVILTSTPEQATYQFLKHGFNSSLNLNTINNLFKTFEEYDNNNDNETEISENEMSIPEIIEEICQKKAKNHTNPKHSILLTKKSEDLLPLLNNKNLKKTLVIFDDCVTNKNQEVQKEMFVRGRHNNINCFYLSQTFYEVDRNYIRKNANVFILFKQNDRNLTSIIQDINIGIDSKKFRQICKEQWRNPKEYKYVLVNTQKSDDDTVSTSVFK